MKPLALMLSLSVVMTGLPRGAGAAPAAAALDTVYITVNQDGSGDATTIQDGLTLALGLYPVVIRVMPGYYDENLCIGAPPPTAAEAAAALAAMGMRAPEPLAAQEMLYDLILIAVGGPGLTTVKGLCPSSSTGLLISGFTIETQVTHAGYQYHLTRWENCVFEGGYLGNAYGGAPNLSHCRFEGPTRLDRYAGFSNSFDDLHFSGGGLQLWTRNEGDYGPLLFRRCVFEGPADTGVVAHPSNENYIRFEDCTFTNLQYGVVAEAGCRDLVEIARGRFSDVAQAAVFMERTGLYNPYCSTLGLSVWGSRFERCGQAVKWWPLLPVPGSTRPLIPPNEEAVSFFGQSVHMSADTILDCTGTAVEMRVQWGGASLSGLVVSGSGGAGIALTNVSDQGMAGNVSVQNSTIQGNAGAGVTLVEQAADVVRQAPVRIVGNVIEHNGGHGLDVTAQEVQASLNIVHENGGDGFRLHTPVAIQTSDIGLNTIAFNRGAGLRHTADPATDPASVLLHHNVALQNGGEGIRGDGVIRHNDAWMNDGGDFVGALIENNLSVDPVFCDPHNGDFTLILGSVCAPDGPFGQIGALGVGCAPTATMLALRSADVKDGTVRLSWFAGGDAIVAARVERRGATSDWKAVGSVSNDGTGMLRFEEPAPGTGRYGYRLVSAAGAAFAEEAWVEIAVVPFTMRVPNPHRGRTITIELSLPGPGEATVELMDVAGRRLESLRLAPGSGVRSALLGNGSALAPGVYVVRVTQGGERRVARVVVVR